MSFLKPEPTALDEAIEEVLRQMQGFTADAPEYKAMVKQLEKLYKIRSNNKTNRVKFVDVLPVIGNLAGIVAILGYERTHIITSKAIAFVMKTRV